MNSLATLLASLLASAHGFGSTPVKEDCFRDGVNEKFFVYSTDNTQMFAVAEAAGGISIPLEVTHGVVGKIWQGMELSITQGNTSITEAPNGKPLTITSPNRALVYISEDFCLPYGDWTVKMSLNTTLNPLVEEDFFTSNEFAPMWSDYVTYPPLVSVGVNLFRLFAINGTLFTCPSGEGCFINPFKLSWGIFPAAMREEAEAARTDSSFGLDFVLYGSQNYNWLKAMAFGDVGVFGYDVQAERWMAVEKLVQVVPAPNQMCWRDDRIWSGPCPRPEGWGEGRRRRLSSGPSFDGHRGH